MLDSLLNFALDNIKNPFYLSGVIVAIFIVFLMIKFFNTTLLTSNKNHLFHTLMDNKHKNSHKFIVFLKKIFKSFVYGTLFYILTFILFFFSELNRLNHLSYYHLYPQKPEPISNSSNEYIILSLIFFYLFYVLICGYVIFYRAAIKKNDYPSYIINLDNNNEIPLNQKVYIDSKISDGLFLCFYHVNNSEKVNVLLPIDSLQNKSIYLTKEKSLISEFESDLSDMSDSLEKNSFLMVNIWATITVFIFIVFYPLVAISNSIPLREFSATLATFQPMYYFIFYIPTYLVSYLYLVNQRKSYLNFKAGILIKQL